MRLLLLDQFSDPGGAQHGLLDLLAACRERGWSAVAGLPGDGPLFERVRSFGFPAEHIDCGPYASGRKTFADAGRFLTGTPRLARQIRQLADSIDAGLVYLNGPRLLPAAALAGLRRPVVFHAHSYLCPGTLRSLAGAALRHLDAWVLGSCRFVAEPWRRFVRPERVSVIYNGVAGPPSGWRRRDGGAPRVGCIGRIAPEKGQREFLAAAQLIHRRNPECTFVIHGAALFAETGVLRYQREVRAAAEGLPVEFTGWVSNVYSALADLDLLLAPSAAHEATTRVILEAFAAGVPAIAFRSGGIPEVVEDGVNGYLVDSVEAMARRAALTLRMRPAERERVSRAAHGTWERRFTLERYQREVADFLWRRQSAGVERTPAA
jgi:glycosyltransferase involved in cell wall biosynthesis